MFDSYGGLSQSSFTQTSILSAYCVKNMTMDWDQMTRYTFTLRSVDPQLAPTSVIKIDSVTSK